MNSQLRKAIQIGGGVFAVVGGLRDLRQFRESGSRLELLQAVLKVASAGVGIVIALKVADEVTD